MEDWKTHLKEAIRPYIEGGSRQAEHRRCELRAWFVMRGLSKLSSINTPHHALELMELINRWRDEDRPKQADAAPPEPSNPFIVEKVKRKLALGWTGDLHLMSENRTSVDIAMNDIRYTPSQLRTLAKQLTDLADAHEAIYPPTDDTCAKAC